MLYSVEDLNISSNLDSGEYKKIILGELPRVLGLCDRDPNSDTRGCFDRNYWHYKLIDLPNVRFQEGMLLLALLHQNDFPGNVYFDKDNIRKWAIDALKFWEMIQNSDGTFAETYPNERSFCGTSFSTYAATETMLILNEHTNLRNITKAGNWLMSHLNSTVANQVAGSIVALHNIYILTGIESFEQAAFEKTEILISLQHETGYYPEYGGYDIGYQTITLSFLAKYYLKSRYEPLKKSLDKGIEFIKAMINERGSFEISGTSRKT